MCQWWEQSGKYMVSAARYRDRVRQPRWKILLVQYQCCVCITAGGSGDNHSTPQIKNQYQSDKKQNPKTHLQSSCDRTPRRLRSCSDIISSVWNERKWASTVSQWHLTNQIPCKQSSPGRGSDCIFLSSHNDSAMNLSHGKYSTHRFVEGNFRTSF